MSRSVRPSTRSRRGRHGSGQSPPSASPFTTRRADAGKESSDSGSPGSEASGGCSQHSRGQSVPKEEQQKRSTPKAEEAPSDLGDRWQRQSASSSEHQRLVPPRSMVTRRLGNETTAPTLRPSQCFWSVCTGSTRLRVKRRTGVVNAKIYTNAEWTKRSVQSGRWRRR